MAVTFKSLISEGEAMTFPGFAAQVQGTPAHEDRHQAINLFKLLLFVRRFDRLEAQICRKLYPSS